MRHVILFPFILFIAFLFSGCSESASSPGEDDGKIIVDFSGFPENYYGVTIKAYLTTVGSTDYSSALVSKSFTITSSGLSTFTMADIDAGFSPGDYDLQILLDYDKNGAYEEDTGDAVLTQSVTIGDTAGLRLDADPFAIPLLMSDNGNSRIVIVDIAEVEDTNDLLDITADTPIYIELYPISESNPAATQTDIINGDYNRRFSFTSRTDSITMTLPAIDGDAGNFYMAYIYFDSNGNATLDSGDLTETLTFISTEEADAPVVDDEDLYPYTDSGMGQHTYNDTDRSDLWNNIWIDYAYTGSQVSNIQDDDDRMCFIVSTSSDIEDCDDPAYIRYYANAGSFENSRTLIGEDSSINYYYIMVIDMDLSESLTPGDLYKVSGAINAWSLDGSTEEFRYSELTEFVLIEN